MDSANVIPYVFGTDKRAWSTIPRTPRTGAFLCTDYHITCGTPQSYLRRMKANYPEVNVFLGFLMFSAVKIYWCGLVICSCRGLPNGFSSFLQPNRCSNLANHPFGEQRRGRHAARLLPDLSRKRKGPMSDSRLLQPNG